MNAILLLVVLGGRTAGALDLARPTPEEAAAVASVKRAYRAILWREPEPGLLEIAAPDLVGGGAARWRTYLAGLARSEEFRALVRPRRSDAELLARLYEHLLGPRRPVDASGRDHYLPRIAQGRFEDVAASVGSSAEFYEALDRELRQGSRPSGPCIAGGSDREIQAALTGPRAEAVLCPGAVFELRRTVVFNAPGQAIYTRGRPDGDRRAVLRIAAPGLVTAVQAHDVSGVSLANVIVDGARPALGWVRGGSALLNFGGRASGQSVTKVKAFETRGWSILHVFEGPGLSCRSATVTENELGPAGQPDGSWADGISLACRNSLVSGNRIVDATDGAIVVFGAPGSLIVNNTIVARSRILLGGVNMVDFGPFDGDYSGVRVEGNRIVAEGALIKTGIAMGPKVWGCGDWAERTVHNGSVVGNRLEGGYFGYGFVASGVENWAVEGNSSSAVHGGVPAGGCDGLVPAPPGPFQKDPDTATGTFQPEFVDAYVGGVLGITLAEM